MPTRNPADKVHYIVRFRDWRLTHSVTLALDVPKMGTIGSGELNSIIDACWHSSLPSPFRAYPKENPVLLGREYLNWLFAVQEFLFRQFIPSIHNVLI